MGLNFLRILLITYGLLSLGKPTLAQCPGGAAPQQYSQATTASIDGDSESFPFDQFDPALGTLIGVDIHANITGLIAMTVINYNTAPKTYNVSVFRKDEMKSPGLGIELIVDTTVSYTTVTLPGSKHPGTAPFYFDRQPNTPPDSPNYESRYVAAPVDRDVYQSITDPAILDNYKGGGSISIDYTLDPGFSLMGSASQAQGIITTYATNIELTVTYTYCPQSILPGGKLTFVATKKSNSNVLLTWTKEHEDENVLYVPEISLNGQDFKTIGSVHSQKPANDATVVKYEFGCDVPAGTSGKLYFRLKQVEPSGEITYSPIKIININEAADLPLTIFPNPANKQVELRFNTPQKQKLQVDMISSVGQLVESRTIDLNGAQQHTFIFGRSHAAGVYFMRILNPSTQENQVVRLVIR